MHYSEESHQGESEAPSVFRSEWSGFHRPGRIVTLGHYYPKAQETAAQERLRETRSEYRVAGLRPGTMRQNLGWTRLIQALTAGRQWPIKRLFTLLEPMLETDIALTVVPTHLAYQAFWPMRTLARQLAESGRIDATSCLVRHTTIRRITFGGPSTVSLHRQTLRLENPELIMDRRVLLLDDIAKSGASLMACQQMLKEAGAALVQPFAIGRVILDREEEI